jgi:radical SAM protein with 4Fe4S-binding SPASM domain
MFGRLVGRVPMGHLWYLLRQLGGEKPHRFGGQVRINTFFPPYPSVAFDRFCRNVIDRARAPYSTYLAVTGRCPWRCEYCSVAGRSGQELSTEQWLDVIGQVKTLGGCTLGFTGGEPLLRDDLEELISAAQPELATIVFTSGHGLDSDRAERLAEVNVTCVTVGIDGADAASHDAVRQKAGSFKMARAAVDACNESGIYPAVSTVAFRERISSGELERMVELADSWGAREFRILAPVATGRMAGCGAAMLTDEERRQLADLHRRCNRRRKGPVIASFARLESDELFGCGAGFHHLFVDPSGEVCPCDLTPLSFGNAAAEPLTDIWQRMAEHFPRPRCGCLMNELAEEVAQCADCLPLTPEQSRDLCTPPAADAPLPGAYSRLLKDRKP